MGEAGTSGSERVRESFRKQAASCRELGSPFTAAICDLLAERLDGSGRFGRKIRTGRATRKPTPSRCAPRAVFTRSPARGAARP